MAMGSAGFLVQVVRYLAERVVEAVEGSRLQGEGSEDLQPFNLQLATEEDKLNYARRLVAERCIYGVDKNPLAVEIAKLSLWLVTLAKERPFTFLDHALKCGDALVGTSADDFLRWARRKKTAEMSLDMEVLREELERARGLRKQLESFVVNDVRDAERKAALLVQADAAMAHVKRGADLLAGVKLLGLSTQEAEDLQLLMVDAFLAGQLDGVIDANKHPNIVNAFAAAKRERVFHWEFEFPEVFERGGFSAFVGNPPFIGGLKISSMFGDAYFRNLRNQYPSSNGTADLCAFFFLRAYLLLEKLGTFGLIATNTIAQGDTRVTGLDEIIKNGCTLYNASPSTAWPGVASVYVSIVHGIKGTFSGARHIDNKQVDFISSLLDDSSVLGNPQKLRENSSKSFIGSYVLGMGFTLEPKEAENLIKKEAKNKDVLFPYLNGQDINSRPDQSPSRYVINFFDWTKEKAAQYPDCFERIEKLVKPERDKLIGRNPIGTKRGEKWWLYGSDSKQLYIAIAPLKRVLVAVQTSKYLSMTFQPKNIVYSHMTVVFALEDFSSFALLTSSLHDYWVRKYASTLETRLRYIPTDCFETFPFPANIEGLEEVGESYYKHRQQTMLLRQEGLTVIYNRLHNPDETAEDIVYLRKLHVELDKRVATLYGWDDLELVYDFRDTEQGVRFTIDDVTKKEILTRLLKLNYERSEEEKKAGGSVKKTKYKERKSKSHSSNDNQIEMF